MPTDEEIYEAYLQACERGEAEEPERFLARHGSTDAALRSRLEVLFRFTRTDGPELAAEPDLPFDRLGSYAVLRRLDRGGMGEIYLGEEKSGRRVALKVIRPELRGAATALERFRREGEALARLDHANIVRVLDTGESTGVVYLVMEFVKGRTLDRVLEEDRPATTTVVGWMRDLAHALEHAHGRGVIHRDVKPSNILVGDDGQPRLLDFGVARDEEWLGPTLTRAFAGSPLYAAPEQLRGGKVDGRADLYALGVTFYQSVTGVIPFEDVSGDRLYVHILRQDPVPPRELNPSLPPRLEHVLGKALAKRPEDRYATGEAFARDLQALLDLRPVSARPPGAWTRLRKWGRRRPGRAAAVAGALALLLLVVGLFAYRSWARGAEGRELARQAESRLRDFRERRREAQQMEERIVELQDRMIVRYLTDEEHELLNRQERAIDQARTDRETAFHEILGLLRRAERLGADPEDLDRLRLDLYLERVDEARTARDPAAMGFFRQLADKLAPERTAQRAPSEVKFNVSPPDARIFLFRVVEQADIVEGGEPRLVPQPVRGKTPVPPGTWVLRVVQGSGAVRRDDLILELAGSTVRDRLFAGNDRGEVRRGDRLMAIDGKPVRTLYDVEAAASPREFEFERARAAADGLEIVDGAGLARRGGVAAVVYRNGERLEIELPRGIDVRTTARPLFTSPACAARSGVPQRLAEGAYLAVFRHPDFAETRYAFDVRPAHDVEADIAMVRRGPEPADFVSVFSIYSPAVRIMEREVTAAEYLEFLNDPENRAAVARGDLVPRGGGEVFWTRRPDGTFAMGAEWKPDWPVLGVSWNDARAYALWRTKRAGRPGWRFELPTQDQWLQALGGGAFYPFGARFRSRWINSCYSQPRPVPESVLRYPIDESMHGVFDMCGSVQEWLLDWHGPDRKLRRLAGGSWARSKPEDFTPYPLGRPPEQATGETGFRLVLLEER